MPDSPTGTTTPRRLACVCIPALALQLLLREHPSWRTCPVVVLDREVATGRVLAANRAALRERIQIGMRYATASTLASGLRAAVCPPELLVQAQESILQALLTCSPRVEAHPSTPGLFWLDPQGLCKLFGSLDNWSGKILDSLRLALNLPELTCSVVVGFTRHATRVLASCGRFSRAIWILNTPAEERAATATVALDDLDFPRKLRRGLGMLGVHTLGGFLRLPPAELSKRFGREAAQLHAHYRGATYQPLQPTIPEPPLAVSLEIDPPDDHRQRLLFVAKGALHALMGQIVARSQKLESLTVGFELDHLSRDEAVTTTLEPAEPTCDSMQVLELLRLRLDQIELPAAVAHLRLQATATLPDAAQVGLLDTPPKRDPRAAGLALARLRALFGDTSITRASLTPGHLPEASFQWEPITTVVAPKVSQYPANNPYEQGLPMVREVFARPLPLPPRPAPNTGLWSLPASTNPKDKRSPVTVRRLYGPFEISGGWWAREVSRSYYYALMANDELRWIYYDSQRDRWFWHGRVD